MTIFTINLNNLRFFARIGVFPQEREVGNDFYVNCSISIDGSKFEDENLKTTISYADVFSVIKKEMDKESLLLESVAKRIMDSLMAQWSEISEGYVEIIKKAPPIPGIDGNCGVKYFSKKRD